ncbi:MAG: hypothetical protein EPN17_03095 [Methylobacter sp.]|nr:MAG: hypothetical protein EPN17_03095 [Methylobacter sp.]
MRANAARIYRAVVAVFVMAIFLVTPKFAYAEEAAAVAVPTGKGLPIVVRTALYYTHIESFDDNNGTFEATTDLRLTWEDPRLRYPASESLNGYKEFRATAAETEIEKIWTPKIQFVNRDGEPSSFERRLRLYPDGKVETMTRTTAVYKTPVDVTHFPFDHQPLEVEIAVREDTLETVALDFLLQDMEFSRVAKNASISGWTLGLVNLRRAIVHGWNGDRYARVIVALDIKRQASGTIATIFTPLFASLLIPFLATWMNKIEDGNFVVEAFELANFIIGGLFAVIALSFTVNSGYPIIAATDNTVTRLVGLNYVALTFGLIIIIVFYRYNFLKRWFGAYVQEQAFLFLTWAFPALSIITGLAFLLAAAA